MLSNTDWNDWNRFWPTDAFMICGRTWRLCLSASFLAQSYPERSPSMVLGNFEHHTLPVVGGRTALCKGMLYVNCNLDGETFLLGDDCRKIAWADCTSAMISSKQGFGPGFFQTQAQMFQLFNHNLQVFFALSSCRSLIGMKLQFQPPCSWSGPGRIHSTEVTEDTSHAMQGCGIDSSAGTRTPRQSLSCICTRSILCS